MHPFIPPTKCIFLNENNFLSPTNQFSILRNWTRGGLSDRNQKKTNYTSRLQPLDYEIIFPLSPVMCGNNKLSRENYPRFSSLIDEGFFFTLFLIIWEPLCAARLIHIMAACLYLLPRRSLSLVYKAWYKKCSSLRALLLKVLNGMLRPCSRRRLAKHAKVLCTVESHRLEHHLS